MASKVLRFAILVLFVCVSAAVSSGSVSGYEDYYDEEEDEEQFAVALDGSNFYDAVAEYDLAVVEFYAPWCEHCKRLAPEYEQAASLLSTLDPPIILAKVDGTNKLNEELALSFGVRSYPTLKILRNGGRIVHDYKGPLDAYGIADYLKKQSGPASVEIKSAEEAAELIMDDNLVTVGIFSEFSGEVFMNFTALAGMLQNEFYFGHTLDANLLPRGESSIQKPVVRDFQVDALEKFVRETSIPTVILWDKDPKSFPRISEFFSNPYTKVVSFLDMDHEASGEYKARYGEVAAVYKLKDLRFLLGDVLATQGALKHYGVTEESCPVLVILTPEGKEYFKEKVAPDDIETFLKDFEENYFHLTRSSHHHERMSSDRGEAGYFI
ncbi:disulfide-isomerase-like protein [Drosera capensis]